VTRWVRICLCDCAPSTCTAGSGFLLSLMQPCRIEETEVPGGWLLHMFATTPTGLPWSVSIQVRNLWVQSRESVLSRHQLQQKRPLYEQHHLYRRLGCRGCRRLVFLRSSLRRCPQTSGQVYSAQGTQARKAFHSNGWIRGGPSAGNGCTGDLCFVAVAHSPGPSTGIALANRPRMARLCRLPPPF